MAGIPALPPGFQLDTTPVAPSNVSATYAGSDPLQIVATFRRKSAQASAPPPAASSVPALPAGFQLDAPAATTPVAAAPAPAPYVPAASAAPAAVPAPAPQQGAQQQPPASVPAPWYANPVAAAQQAISNWSQHPASTGWYDTPASQGMSGGYEGLATAAGFPVDTINTALRGGAFVANRLGAHIPDLPVNAFGGRQTFENAMGPLIAQPSANPVSQIARSVGNQIGASAVPDARFLAAASNPVEMLTRQLAASTGAGVAPTVINGAASQLGLDPNNPWVQTAATAAQIAAGGAPYAKLVTPHPANATQRAAAETLKQEGVQLTAGQATGDTRLLRTETQNGGEAAGKIFEAQERQFTRGALARAHVNADVADAATMDRAFDEKGAQFEALGSRNAIFRNDPALGLDLHRVRQKYDLEVSAGNRSKAVDNTISDITKKLTTGKMSGLDYIKDRSVIAAKLRGLRSAAVKDVALQDAYQGIEDALDSAMERSIAINSPNDLGAFRAIRHDYRNLLVIENAMGRGGPVAARGMISPANLSAAIRGTEGKRSFVRGRSDFSKLANAGEIAMKHPNSSGSVENLAAKAGSHAPKLGMALLAAMEGSPDLVQALAKGGGMLAFEYGLPALSRAKLMSPLNQAYLKNQLMARSMQGPNPLVGPAMGMGMDTAAQVEGTKRSPYQRMLMQGLN